MQADRAAVGILAADTIIADQEFKVKRTDLCMKVQLPCLFVELVPHKQDNLVPSWHCSQAAQLSCAKVKPRLPHVRLTDFAACDIRFRQR
jgi:hypothetical protein